MSSSTEMPASRAARPLLLSSVALLGIGLALLASPTRVRAATAGDPVIAAAGDIACRPSRASTATSCQQGKTAALVSGLNPTAVLPLGDTQYDSSSPAEYAGSYDPTWGALKGVSHPAVGNHEYLTSGATGYFGYFGASAGDPAKGYYSYDINGPDGAFRWHVIALNSECAQIGGCGVGSAEERWLKSDLAANQSVCTIAYDHRPRFSSGTVGSSATYSPFTQDLYNAGADILLSGHAHIYERFAPQTASGAADPARGITQFVVGTGGEDFQGISTPAPNSVVRQNTAFGVLKMTLHQNSYDYQFVPAAGYAFTDSGSGTCHSAPAPDTTPPSQPTGLTASAQSASKVSLSWTASTDAVGVKGYNIFRAANGATPTLLTTTTTNATTFADTSVTASTAYTYQVQAIDAAGNASAISADASVTTPANSDATAPSAPTNLIAEVISGGEVDLSWGASSDAGTGVSGYRISRAPSGTGTWTLLATTIGEGVRYQDLSTVANKRYDYRVTAFDGAANESDPSNIATAATPPGPSTRTYTFDSAGDATIDRTNAATNYGADGKLVVDNSPVDDTLLKFNVAAAPCETVTGAILRLTNKSDGSVRGGDFYTTGAWSENSVSWNNAPGRGALLNSLGAVTSGGTYTVDVTRGVTTSNGEVDFRVGSTSSDGTRYYSKESATAGQRPQLSVTCTQSATDTLEPTTPGDLSAIAPSDGEVDLSWTASTDNAGVTGYRIYRGTSLIGTVAGTALSYQDLTVRAGTTYDYQVSAIDAANNESAKSNTATVATPANPDAPEAPTALSGTAPSQTEVDLGWTASPTPGVTGYNVYRAPTGTTNFARVGSTGTTPGYQDLSVSPGTGYDYWVTAFDEADDESPASNTATVTTPAPSPPPSPQTYTFASAADATIDKANAGTNYGVDKKLVVDNSPVDDSLIRFNISTTGCTQVLDATLRLTDNADGSVKGGDLYAAGSVWSEPAVNWGNAPARGALVGSLGAVTAGATYTLNVTGGVTTLNGAVSFRMGSTSGDGAHYYSKEGGTAAQRPQLTLTCS